jgi:hypothetical protein
MDVTLVVFESSSATPNPTQAIKPALHLEFYLSA